jgi:hypothetical protein
MRILGVEKWQKQFGEDLWEHPDLFAWDWGQVPSDDFFEKLDVKLSSHGLEVVQLEFDGDAYFWYIDKKEEGT